jgi:branched-chain amino acid transport system ATP-binding protein
MTSLLEVEGLRAGYNRVAVVRDLSLRVDQGEVVSLMGPNGAGKSTTLLTICGILRPIAGAIRFEGKSVASMRPERLARTGMGLVPEDRALFTGLTVGENLRLVGRRRDRDRSVDRVVTYFPELGRIINRRAGLLSGGEQQMLAVGRLLASAPRLVMIDEMSLGLAPLVVERLLRAVREIANDSGCGVILVEQHVQLALENADRAYVLAHGNLVADGPTSELRQNRRLLEASYLGTPSLDSNVSAATDGGELR